MNEIRIVNKYKENPFCEVHILVGFSNRIWMNDMLTHLFSTDNFSTSNYCIFKNVKKEKNTNHLSSESKKHQ